MSCPSGRPGAGARSGVGTGVTCRNWVRTGSPELPLRLEPYNGRVLQSADAPLAYGVALGLGAAVTLGEAEGLADGVTSV